eukprot:8215245-Pyramimonas_sp.AAC.1
MPNDPTKFFHDRALVGQGMRDARRERASLDATNYRGTAATPHPVEEVEEQERARRRQKRKRRRMMRSGRQSPGAPPNARAGDSGSLPKQP